MTAERTNVLAQACVLALLATGLGAEEIPDRRLSVAELAAKGRLTYRVLTDRAEMAYVGTIVSLSSSRSGPRGKIMTDVTLSVGETLKGDLRDQVTFKVPGGQVGSDLRWVSHQAQFNELGEEVIVFLDTHEMNFRYHAGDIVVSSGNFGRKGLNRSTPEASRSSDLLIDHIRKVASGESTPDVVILPRRVEDEDPVVRPAGKTMATPSITRLEGFNYPVAEGKIRLDNFGTNAQSKTLDDVLTIVGTNFGSAGASSWLEIEVEDDKKAVRDTILSTDGAIDLWTSTKIEVVLPDNAQTGDVKVRTSGGTSGAETVDIVFNTIGENFWEDGHASSGIKYWMNYDLPADSTVTDIMAGSQTYNDAKSAVDASFDTWEDVEYSDIVFSDQGLTTVYGDHDTDSRQVVLWVAVGDGSGAATDLNANFQADTLYDADIIMNYHLKVTGGYETLLWTTNGASNAKDVQDVVTHEIGHLLGTGDLYGLADTLKTMYFSSGREATHRRSLTGADESFATWVHYSASPRPAAQLERLTGQAVVPGAFEVESIYPNPFNPQVNITLHLERRAEISVSIYNSVGQIVRRLLDGRVTEAGVNRLLWDGTDDMGYDVSSGTYVVELVGDQGRSSRTMTLAR